MAPPSDSSVREKSQTSAGKLHVPRSLAIVDGQSEFAQHLALQLSGICCKVAIFPNSDDLITSQNPFGFAFYVMDFDFPGVDGPSLIRLIRRRTAAGILVLSSRAQPNDFETALGAGADMFLTKPVRLEQALLSIQAIERRAYASTHGQSMEWKLDARAKQLASPDGKVVDLSPTDAALMDCFVDAEGGLVTHEKIKTVLGLPADTDTDNALHAAIYRLKRRIERSTLSSAPLQSQSRSGYVFKGTLVGS